MAAGIAMNVYGQLKSNADKASAEAANASFYREQAAFAQEAGDRAAAIADRKNKRVLGEEVGAFAKGNVDIGSGSALDVLAEQRTIAIEEQFAIKREADMNVRLANLRANASMDAANAYRDPTNNALQAAGTILTGASHFAA
jgi:hypothetical protein